MPFFTTGEDGGHLYTFCCELQLNILRHGPADYAPSVLLQLQSDRRFIEELARLDTCT